ncbi:MAG TPA: SDR family NAD(P)-dependent oxidoreductase, partial [Agriterribacter sp.]|nr:SDR family NAD(P)-dependent oxidoreductase [Agriterribacter sp.]
MIEKTAFSLQGRLVLVTGASSGIGLAICRSVVGSGGKVIGVARREDRLNEMVKELGEANASFINADLSADAGIEKVIAGVPEIDGLVYAAGISKLSPLKFIKRQMLEEVMNVNYFSMVLLLAGITRYKKLKRNTGSSVVLISSIAQ